MEEIDGMGYKWDGIKTLKKKFTPTFCKFKDKEGKHTPVKEYAGKKQRNTLETYSGRK